MDRKKLVVIGAGPKGIAIAVKAKVLREMDLPVDDVILIEKHSVGAHWSGEAGYTDGEMRLGTSPEKDVVFPLETTLHDPVLDKKIKNRLMHFTWASYLIENGNYSDWVDRGKPAPKHLEWAAYLKWVATQLSPEVTIINAQVNSIDIDEKNENWLISLDTGKIITAQRLMLTGPGKVKTDSRVFDLETFWKSLKSGDFPHDGKIAIVGTGENAASSLIALSNMRKKLQIEVISPRGFISTRAENYYENQFYSQPQKCGWHNLDLEDRKEFIKRTDLGVFSVHAMQILNCEDTHKIIPGRVIDITQEGEKKLLTVEYGQLKCTHSYDEVIMATGFDPISSLKSIFSKSAYSFMEKAVGFELNKENVALAIDDDLSVQGLTPKLHLPMIAGLKQGPGFSNLSCLGLLSDRVVLFPMIR